MIQTVFKILTSNDLSRIILVSKFKKKLIISGPYVNFWKGGGGECEFKGFIKGVLILSPKSGV